MKTLIVSITYYKNTSEIRFQLALQFIAKAVAANHPVVIVDGSPDPTIGEFFKQAGALVYPQLHKGMGACQRQAFFHANEVAMETDSKIIFWSEPEKHDIIQSIPKAISRLEYGVDIVVLKRSDESWKTWPKFQQQTETETNKTFNETFGTVKFDPMFGPVAFRREFASDFMSFDSKKYGVIDAYNQHFVPMVLWYKGKCVCTTEVEMTYPPEQREEEEGLLQKEMQEKRIRQRNLLIESYKNLAKKLGVKRIKSH